MNKRVLKRVLGSVAMVSSCAFLFGCFSGASDLDDEFVLDDEYDFDEFDEYDEYDLDEGSDPSEDDTENDEEENQTGLREVAKEDMPEGLDDFFEDLCWVREYDFENEEDILELTNFMCCCPGTALDFKRYADVTDLVDGDGFALTNADKTAYVYEASDVEWILRVVFNAGDDAINRVRSTYLKDGKYEFQAGGIGGFFMANITKIETDGDRYYIDWYVTNDMDVDYKENYHSVLEYKKVDGEYFWSLYSTRKQ